MGSLLPSNDGHRYECMDCGYSTTNIYAKYNDCPTCKQNELLKQQVEATRDQTRAIRGEGPASSSSEPTDLSWIGKLLGLVVDATWRPLVVYVPIMMFWSVFGWEK